MTPAVQAFNIKIFGSTLREQVNRIAPDSKKPNINTYVRWDTVSRLAFFATALIAGHLICRATKLGPLKFNQISLAKSLALLDLLPEVAIGLGTLTLASVAKHKNDSLNWYSRRGNFVKTHRRLQEIIRDHGLPAAKELLNWLPKKTQKAIWNGKTSLTFDPQSLTLGLQGPV